MQSIGVSAPLLFFLCIFCCGVALYTILPFPMPGSNGNHATGYSPGYRPPLKRVQHYLI